MSAWADPGRWAALVDGSGCPICLSDLPGDLVLELQAVWVTAPRQSALDCSLTLFAKRHAVEPFELTEAESVAFWADVDRVASALRTALTPIKLNYEIHGNTIPHLHVNLYPRFVGDRFDGGPIDARIKFERSDGEMERLKSILEPLREGSADAAT